MSQDIPDWKLIMQTDRDMYLEWVDSEIRKRLAVGEERYRGSERGFQGDPLQHAREELLDGLFYVYYAIRERNALREEIERLRNVIERKDAIIKACEAEIAGHEARLKYTFEVDLRRNNRFQGYIYRRDKAGKREKLCAIAFEDGSWKIVAAYKPYNEGSEFDKLYAMVRDTLYNLPFPKGAD